MFGCSLFLYGTENDLLLRYLLFIHAYSVNVGLGLGLVLVLF